jgi:hypothetical protein
MTPQQLFFTVARKAEQRAARDGVPLTKLLNRLDVQETNQMVDALAEQFRLLVRDVLDRGVDPHAKPVPWRERIIRRQRQMRVGQRG